MLNVLLIRHSYIGVALALGMGPVLRPLTKASVASRSQRAQHRGARRVAPTPIYTCLFFVIGPAMTSFFCFSCFGRKVRPLPPAKRQWWRVRARISLGRPLGQSAPQLEPHASCAQNSNRCQSPGLGLRARICKEESEHYQ
jgi:hypothetical protein